MSLDKKKSRNLFKDDAVIEENSANWRTWSRMDCWVCGDNDLQYLERSSTFCLNYKNIIFYDFERKIKFM